MHSERYEYGGGYEVKKKTIITALLIIMISCISYNVHAASYGNDYTRWSQGASDYASVRGMGCAIVALTKLIHDEEIDPYVNPDQYAVWEEAQGLISWLGNSTDWNILQKNWSRAIVDYAELQGIKAHYYGNLGTSDTQLWNNINNGYRTIILIGEFEHYVYLANELSQRTGRLYIYESYSDSTTAEPCLLHDKYTVKSTHVYQVDSIIGNPEGPVGQPSISLNQYWYDIGDTIDIQAKATNATNYYYSLYKDDELVQNGTTRGGRLRVSASAYGQGHYSVCFSCFNLVETKNTEWVDFDVVGAPECVHVSLDKESYTISDTVSVIGSGVCYKNMLVVIDDSKGNRLIETQIEGDTYQIPARNLGVGDFYACCIARNNSGGTQSEEWVTIHIEADNPVNKPVVSLNQDWYDLGDTVEIQVTAVNAANYYYSLYKNDNLVSNGYAPNGSLEFKASEYGQGEYSILFSCFNDEFSTDSDWTHFSVVGAPSEVGLASTKLWFSIDDMVELKFSAVHCKDYVVMIEDSDGKRVTHTVIDGDTYKIKASQLGAGTFYVCNIARNNSGTTQCDTWYTFTIVEKPEVRLESIDYHRLQATVIWEDIVKEQGIIYTSERAEVTLDTLGRTRVAYTELSSDGTLDFDADLLDGSVHSIRAYIIYTNKDGEDVIAYSDVVNI